MIFTPYAQLSKILWRILYVLPEWIPYKSYKWIEDWLIESSHFWVVTCLTLGHNEVVGLCKSFEDAKSFGLEFIEHESGLANTDVSIEWVEEPPNLFFRVSKGDRPHQRLWLYIEEVGLEQHYGGFGSSVADRFFC